MRFGRYLTLLCASIWLFGSPAAHAADERLYSAAHPYYAESCALSQIKKKPGFGADIRGGPGGHSVLYLNGVCRDKGAHYPKIALCDPASSPAQQGVGLSVNAHFKNAYWVATEGRDFFFHGNLQPNERLTRAVYERTQAQAMDMGILDGVEFHAEVFDDMPAGASRRNFMYEMSVSTDYAVGFGRDRYCTRVPMEPEQMRKMVEFLNGQNEIYRSGKEEFEWNVLQNNCSHMTHNALASAGLWDDWETDRFILISAFDFPVPANEFVNLTRRTNDLPIDNLDLLYADSMIRDSLMRENWLPMQAGSLVEWEHVKQDNDVYDTDVELIFYDEPIFAVYPTHAAEILSQPRYFDMRANLKYFSDLYRHILLTRKPLDWYMDRSMPEAKRQEFPAFYDRFYHYIDQQSARVEAQLAALPPAS